VKERRREVEVTEEIEGDHPLRDVDFRRLRTAAGAKGEGSVLRRQAIEEVWSLTIEYLTGNTYYKYLQASRWWH